MTQSLIIAQQCSIDNLEQLEEESGGYTVFDGASKDFVESDLSRSSQQRTSVWLNGLIFDNNFSTAAH
jgi:hypothetical protein